MTQNAGSEADWTSNRRISVGVLALVSTLMIQAGAGIWWAGAITASSKAMATEIAEVRARDRQQSDQIRTLEDRTADGRAQAQALTATLVGVAKALEIVRGDVVLTNSLLREMMRNTPDRRPPLP